MTRFVKIVQSVVGAGVPSIFRTSSRNSVGTSRTRQRPRLVENVSGEFIRLLFVGILR